MALPTLPNAIWSVEFNIGGTGPRSQMYEDRIATQQAKPGDTILAFKATNGNVTMAPASDIRGPVLTKAGMMGNVPVLNFHDQCPVTPFTSTGFSQNVGSTGSYFVIAVILTPRQYRGYLPGGTTAITNHPVSGLNDTGARQLIYRNATGTKWGGWGQTPGWIEGSAALPIVDREVLIWEYFYSGGVQQCRLWRNGVADTLKNPNAYPTSLTSISLPLGGGQEAPRFALAYWALGVGTIDSNDVASIMASVNTQFPDPVVTGTHSSLSTFNLDTKGNGATDGHQGYTRDAAGNHYTTRSGQLRKFAPNRTLLLNKDTGVYPPVGTFNHTGGACQHSGLLYTVHSNGVIGSDIALAWYDTSTFAMVDWKDITKSPIVPGDGAGVAVCPKRKLIYVVGWSESSWTSDAATKFWAYDLVTKNYVGSIAVGNIRQIEGASVRDDHIYFMSDDHTLWRMHLDHPGEREYVASFYNNWSLPTNHGSDIEMAAHNGVPKNQVYAQVSGGAQDNHQIFELNTGAPGMYYPAVSAAGVGSRHGIGIGMGIGL